MGRVEAAITPALRRAQAWALAAPTAAEDSEGPGGGQLALAVVDGLTSLLSRHSWRRRHAAATSDAQATYARLVERLDVGWARALLAGGNHHRSNPIGSPTQTL